MLLAQQEHRTAFVVFTVLKKRRIGHGSSSLFFAVLHQKVLNVLWGSH